jgi:hypothetical protein
MAVESIGRHAQNVLSSKYHCRIEKYGLQRTSGGGVLFTALTDKELDVQVIAADINRTADAKHGAEAKGHRDHNLINVYDSSNNLERVYIIGKEAIIKWILARLWMREDYFYFPGSMTPVIARLDELENPNYLTVGPVMHETWNGPKHVVRAPLLYRGRCIMVLRRQFDDDEEGNFITIDLPEGDEDPFVKYASDGKNLKIIKFPSVNWFFDK